jgi:hypothetical protein
VHGDAPLANNTTNRLSNTIVARNAEPLSLKEEVQIQTRRGADSDHVCGAQVYATELARASTVKEVSVRLVNERRTGCALRAMENFENLCEAESASQPHRGTLR